MHDAMGTVLGLVGLVKVFCDWVRWQVWPATPLDLSGAACNSCLSRSVAEVHSVCDWDMK